MMEMFLRAARDVAPPDLEHTWAQAPIKFEDVFGRIMPVPAEYDWDLNFQVLLLR